MLLDRFSGNPGDNIDEPVEDSYNQDKRRDEFMKIGGLDFSRIEVVKLLAAAATGANRVEKTTAAAGCHEQQRKPSPTAARARFLSQWLSVGNTSVMQGSST